MPLTCYKGSVSNEENTSSGYRVTLLKSSMNIRNQELYSFSTFAQCGLNRIFNDDILKGVLFLFLPTVPFFGFSVQERQFH